MRRWERVGCALLLLLLPACRPAGGDGLDGPVPDDPSTAVLVGRLGPGVPPDGGVPAEVELLFTSRTGATARTTARDGRYEVTLSPGSWDVRAPDGKACAVGISLAGGARQRHDLTYPGACMDAAPPPAPQAPPPAPQAPPPAPQAPPPAPPAPSAPPG